MSDAMSNNETNNTTNKCYDILANDILSNPNLIIPHKKNEFLFVLKTVSMKYKTKEYDNVKINILTKKIFNETNRQLFKMRYDLTKMYIYVIKLENDKWYVGQSNNPLKKFKSHKSKKGAAYFTRKHKPIELAYSFNCYKILRFFDLKIETKFCIFEEIITDALIVKYGAENVQGGSKCGLKYDLQLSIEKYVFDNEINNKFVSSISNELVNISLDDLDDFIVFENTTEGRINLMQGYRNLNLFKEKISSVNIINNFLISIKKLEMTKELLMLNKTKNN